MTDREFKLEGEGKDLSWLCPREMMMEEDQQVEYIRAKQLEDQYSIDRIAAWRWSRDQSKAFPKAIRLAPNVSVYDRAEVDARFKARKESDIR